MVWTLDHWLNGTVRPPSTGIYQDRRSPVDGRIVSRVADGSVDDVTVAVESAKRGFLIWRDITPAVRGHILTEIARLIRADSEELVARESAETGKPFAAAASEVEGAAAYFEFYGGVINTPAGENIDLGPNYHSYTRHEPFGVVAVITPWNLPINQAARAGAPALAVGNAIVLKPSSLTSATSVRLGELATEAGMPAGVLNVVLGTGSRVGGALVAHPDVRKVAFTGSVEVGRELGHVAADRIIPLTLELGGKSASIVFADADLERAAERSTFAFTANAGQVCSAGTRLLVQRSAQDELVTRLVQHAKGLRFGETIGPLISKGQFDTVRSYLEVAEADGALPVTGGLKSIDDTRPGYFVEPTVYTHVS